MIIACQNCLNILKNIQETYIYSGGKIRPDDYRCIKCNNYPKYFVELIVVNYDGDKEVIY